MSDPAKHIWDQRYKSRKTVSPMTFALKAYKYLKDQPRCSILDVGCGDGRDAIFFAEKECRVTAIDSSEEAVKKVISGNPSIDARVMDIEEMDFPDESFDAIYAHLSLHYFDDKTTNKIFKNICRMLKSNGYFFVKCKSTSDLLYGKGEKVGEDMYILEYQRHFFSKEYMREKLASLTIIELEEVSGSYNKKKSSFIEAVAGKE